MKTLFKNIKLGQQFSLSEKLTHLNVKIANACIYTDGEGFVGELFNVISLVDGRPRTFNDDAVVYIATEPKTVINIGTVTGNIQM